MLIQWCEGEDFVDVGVCTSPFLTLAPAGEMKQVAVLRQCRPDQDLGRRDPIKTCCFASSTLHLVYTLNIFLSRI